MRTFAIVGRWAWLFLAAAALPYPAKAQWVAYNDHASGPGTHPNATRYNILGAEDGTNGFLKHIFTGTELPVMLRISRSGVVQGDPSGGEPAMGTPLETEFGEYVDFAQSSVHNNVGFRTGGFVTYTFSGLDPSKGYSLMGGAVRGSSSFTNRWARIELAGSEGFTANHSPGTLDSTQVPADLAFNQVALNSGANHTPQTGDMFRWDDIDPGPDGVIELICTRYAGMVPGGNSGTATTFGYAPVAIRLQDVHVDDVPITILAQPVYQIVNPGQSATFTVVAGNISAYYQWFRDGLPIPGATKRSYTLDSVTLEDSGAVFSVVVSNRLNAVESDGAALYVTRPPSNVLAFSHGWRYEASGTDLGVAWRAADYDDSGWQSGPGLLGFETATLPEPLRTTFVQHGGATYYFRTTFEFPYDPVEFDLRVTNLLDDGAVFYLNGTEWFRVGMPVGSIGINTLANRSVGDAAFETLTFSPNPLVQGINVLAVEVHQANVMSSDMVLGMRLDAIPVVPSPLSITAHPESLEVVELAPVSFSVEVSGMPIWYQWYHDGLPIPDATRSTFSIPSATIADVGMYRVNVSNVLGQTFSQPARLTVLTDTNAPVLLTAQGDQGSDLVLVTFSESVLESSATNAVHYQITNTLGQPVQVLEVRMLSPSQVLVRTVPRPAGFNYLIAAQNISDVSPQFNLMGPGPPLAVSTRFDLVSYQDLWDFYDPFPGLDELDLGTAWKEPDYQPGSTWGQGSGAFVYDLGAQSLPVPAGTALSQGSITKYFRRTFDFSASPFNIALRFSHVVDDGAIVYLNGREVYRYNLPQSFVSFLTPALSGLPAPLTVQTVPLDPDAFESGPNVLAVELHGSGDYDLDYVFASELTADVQSLAVGPVLILRSPADETVVEGQPALFTFDAIGAGDFQWFENDVPIPGATRPSLSILAATLAQSGAAYHVLAANDDFSATSEAAVLMVVPDTTAPTLVAAYYEDNSFDRILVTFSEPVDETSGSRISNYTLGGGATAAPAILSASVTNGNQVLLQLTGPASGVWLLTVQGVSDTALTPNVIRPGSRVTVGFNGPWLTMDSAWKHETSGSSLGTTWRTPGYDDAAWLAGPGVLGFPANEPLLSGEVVRTLLPQVAPGSGNFLTNIYFRKAFDFFAPTSAVVTLSNLIDDGAVFYLNGTELGRFAMPNGAVTYHTFALRQDDIVSASHGYETLAVPTGSLVQGQNLLAVEVHQGNNVSGDLVFGCLLHVFVPSQTLVPGPRLEIVLDNQQVSISWMGAAWVLESSDTPDGPDISWAPVVPQENPYRIVPAEAKKFYRLRP